MAVVVAALIASAGRVEAEPARILVTYFEGRAGAVRTAALQAIRKCCSLPNGRAYERVARKRRAWKYTPAQVTELARELDADGVLTGTMVRRGGAFRVTLRLHDGKTGQEVAVVNLRLRRPRLRPADRRQLERQLVAAVRKLEQAREAEGDGAPPDENALEEIAGIGADGGDAGDAGVYDSAAARPRAAGNLDPWASDGSAQTPEASLAGPAPATGAPAPVMRAAPAPVTKPALARYGAALRLGASATGRQLRSSVSAPEIHGPGYSAPPAPGVRVDAEIYPAALIEPESGAVGNLGMRLGFEQVLGLTSRLDVSDDMSVELDTVHRRFDVDLMWRVFFGSGAERPALVFMAGYDRLLFEVDETGAPDDVVVDLPDVDYSSVTSGLRLHWPLSSAIATTLGTRVLYVLDAGQMSRKDSFGDSTSVGLDAGLDFELRLTRRVSLRLGGGVQYFRHSLDGNGAESNLRDGDAETVDVTGLNDLYFGGRATTSFVF